MISRSPDVAVIGGGPAGLAASVAAARQGASVVLVDRYGFLGGTATAAMVTPMAAAFFQDTQIVKGLFQELVDRMVLRGGCLGYLKTVETTRGWGGYLTPFDPCIMQLAAQELVLEAKVEPLLHSLLVGVKQRGGRIDQVIVATKEGQVELAPGIVVDATGDADVADMAGCDIWKGRDSDGLMQPATLMMRILNVDTAALRTYVREHPDDFAWYAFPRYSQPVPDGYENQPVFASGFISILKNAYLQGELYFGRSRFLFASGLRQGELYLNATRVNGVDGTSSEDLTRAETDARKQAWSLFSLLRREAPGFQKAYLLETGSQIGVRETRRIVGEYTISDEDILGGRTFTDAIACGAYPIDIHEVKSEWGLAEKKESLWIDLPSPYDIPYRSLIPRGMKNLLAAGRCISASHMAHGSLRVQPIAMAIGQAAGTAAGLAACGHLSDVRDLDYGELRRKLIDQGVYLRQEADGGGA